MTTPKQITADAIAEAKKVGSQSISQLNKLIEEARQLNQDLRNNKSEMEHNLSLQSARKIQGEHDRAEAIKAKTDKTGVSIMRNGLTNENIVESAMLSLLNQKQTAKGLPTFKSYSEYIGMNDLTATPYNDNSIVPTTTNDPVTPLDKIVEASLDYAGRPLLAGGEVFHIVSGGYYVAWNRSRCYLQNEDTNEINILVVGDRLFGELSTMAVIPNKSFRDLTKPEFDSIVSGKPAYKDLFKVFSKTQNFQNVQLNLKNTLPVW